MDEPTAPATPEPAAPEELAPPEAPEAPDPGGPVTCRTCGCEFGVHPATVVPGTRLSCPVCRTPCPA